LSRAGGGGCRTRSGGKFCVEASREALSQLRRPAIFNNRPHGRQFKPIDDVPDTLKRHADHTISNGWQRAATCDNNLSISSERLVAQPHIREIYLKRLSRVAHRQAGIGLAGSAFYNPGAPQPPEPGLSHHPRLGLRARNARGYVDDRLSPRPARPFAHIPQTGHNRQPPE